MSHETYLSLLEFNLSLLQPPCTEVMVSSALTVCQQDCATQKLLNLKKKHSVERWHEGHGRNRQILVATMITLRYGTLVDTVRWAER